MSRSKRSSLREREANPALEVRRESEWRYGKAKRISHPGAEKEFLRLGYKGPYRKPTQVGEMSILRRTEERALRNSAKCTRNFGRSVAFALG